MAHLTCQGHTRRDIDEILDDYLAANVENILALGGDPPAGDVTARERLPVRVRARRGRGRPRLVLDRRRRSPRGAPAVARSATTDRQHLAAKLRRADFAITQFFFEADHYLALVDELAALGVDKPVLPGIMPITNVGQVSRMAELSGTAVPAWLVERVGRPVDDVRGVGARSGSRSPPSCAPSCSTPVRRGCTSTR